MDIENENESLLNENASSTHPSPDGRKEFELRACCQLCMGCWIGVAVIAGLLLLIFWQIHLFILYHFAKCEQNLPLWMLVSAIITVLLLVQPVLALLLTSSEAKCVRVVSLFCVHPFVLVLALFWLLVGASWVYSIRQTPRICPAAVYNFAFYYITVAWVLIGALLVFLCSFRTAADLWNRLSRPTQLFLSMSYINDASKGDPRPNNGAALALATELSGASAARATGSEPTRVVVLDLDTRP